MIDKPGANSSAACWAYCALLIQLHQTFRGDEDESPEADAIRDLMDEPWSRMSPEEREAAGRLSEWLYSAREGRGS